MEIISIKIKTIDYLAGVWTPIGALKKTRYETDMGSYMSSPVELKNKPYDFALPINSNYGKRR